MFNFFKKRNVVSDLSWLGIDIHSHILPGIDDGAKELSQSLFYIKGMYDLGFHKLLFTPHIFTDLYPNSSETIVPALQMVTDALKNQDFEIEIGAAAEYMTDNSFLVQDDHLCLPNNHILIEMSYLSETPNIEELIFNLQVKGYRVVLAHPERYNFYHKDLKRYSRLKEMGCLFQLNLLSVLGYYGKEVKLASEHLLKNNMYDLAGSDLHHEKHLSILTENVINGRLFNHIGKYEFKNKQLFG